MKPVFSVIIPVYNKAHTAGRALGSVLEQSFPGFELIVVDDGSTDAIAEEIRKFKDDRIAVLQQPNRGASAARNLGMERAEGQYIAFLDADDFWEKDHLEELLKLCRAFPKAGMYCTRYRKVFSERVQQAAVFKGIPDDFFGLLPDYFEACGRDSVASASSVCMAAAVFETVGVFNTAMRSGEDTEMWIRTALQYPVALNGKITVNYNLHIRESLSKARIGANKLKLLSAFTSEERNHPALKKYMDLNRYALALNYTIQGDKDLRKEALQNLDLGNVNRKQRLLLRLPGFFLKLLKKIQYRLARNGIFLSAFGC